MQHLPIMIHDLALILGTAAVITLIFRKLKQPVILGYLLAGFLVGPFNTLLPTVVDTENVKLWGEMGVIFLLFALGLEFSFKKLLRVGGTTAITALFETSFMLCLGFITGKIMGWNFMDSLFLGGIISISSTSVILRTLDELGLKNKKFATVVLSVLIVEDLVAVLLLVLLSTVALTRQFAGLEMLTSILKLAFFLMIWFLSGMFILPSLMKRSQKLLNEETVLVISVGLCLCMVVFANSVGFSSALGAFVTGSLLAETIEAERIHHLVRPVKDLFSAVFFVSIGMLLNPQVIIQHFAVILAISGVVIFGKFISVSIGSLFSGQGLQRSIQTGVTLSQIGEFSFIIATLGLSFGVISQNLYPLAVAVCVLTTFTTPYMVKSGELVFRTVELILPQRWLEGIANYSQVNNSLSDGREWRILIKSYMAKMVLNAVVVIAIFLLMAKMIFPWLLEKQIEEGLARLMTLSLTLILSAPFLWAVAFGKTKNIHLLTIQNESQMGAPNYFFIISRLITTVILVGAMVVEFVPWYWALAITAAMMVIVGSVMFRTLEKAYHWFELKFLINYNDDSHHISPPQKPKTMLMPWDAHITEFQVSAEASFIGKPLHELSIRENYGVTIALIERGKLRISAPNRNEMLMPFDKLFVIGTDEQLERFKEFLKTDSTTEENVDANTIIFSLERYEVTSYSPYIDKNIRECGLRELTHGLVVGIERSGKRILNPDSTEIIKNGDTLWIVGERDRILALS